MISVNKSNHFVQIACVVRFYYYSLELGRYALCCCIRLQGQQFLQPLKTVPFPTTELVEQTPLSITICICGASVNVRVVTQLGLALVMQCFLYALFSPTFAVNFVRLFCISGKKRKL